MVRHRAGKATGRWESRGACRGFIFEYLIGRATGFERASEVHELGLFTVDEMQQCFEEAGLAATYDPQGPSGRGLYVARTAGPVTPR